MTKEEAKKLICRDVAEILSESHSHLTDWILDWTGKDKTYLINSLHELIDELRSRGQTEISRRPKDV